MTLNEAKAYLKNEGWTYVCSIMSDTGKQTGHYGLLFIRNGEKFYLNVDTIGEVGR